MTENEKLVAEAREYVADNEAEKYPDHMPPVALVRRLADALEAAETLKSKERGTCARRT